MRRCGKRRRVYHIHTKTDHNRLTAVAKSLPSTHTSRCIAIYYFVLKLDNNDQTCSSVIHRHRTYCVHTGCKINDLWNWKQADKNGWIEWSLSLFSTSYFFHQPQAWKNRLTWHLLPVCIGLNDTNETSITMLCDNLLVFSFTLRRFKTVIGSSTISSVESNLSLSNVWLYANTVKWKYMS